MKTDLMKAFREENGHFSTLEAITKRFTAREANVLVRAFNVGKSAGGIILQKGFVSTPGRYAEVVSVGPGPYTSTGQIVKIEDLCVGDVVVIRPNSGIEVKLRLSPELPEESFLILACHEILLRFELGVEDIIA